MADIAAGDTAPDFSLEAHDGRSVSLADYKGKWLVLYFYPKDNTSGCTREACEFSDETEIFAELNTEIIGVSRDSVKSHASFVDKKGLRITLLSDMEHEVISSYGAWKMKKNYGRESMGIERSTFLIDPEGTVRRVWRKVKVAGHVAEVKEALRELSAP